MIKTGKHSLLGLVLQGTATEWQYDVLCEDLGVRGAVLFVLRDCSYTPCYFTQNDFGDWLAQARVGLRLDQDRKCDQNDYVV